MSKADLPGAKGVKIDPPHVFVTGQTMMGKSTIARLMMRPYLNNRVPVAVYSPVEPASKWDDRAIVFVNFYDFIIYIRNNMPNGGLLVVDEADTVLSQGDRENWWLGTRSRHFGFRAIILTQRPALVAPTVRGQCAECYVFNIAAEDAKILSRDYNAPALRDAPKLRQGHYLKASLKDGVKVVEKGRVF